LLSSWARYFVLSIVCSRLVYISLPMQDFILTHRPIHFSRCLASTSHFFLVLLAVSLLTLLFSWLSTFRPTTYRFLLHLYSISRLHPFLLPPAQLSSFQLADDPIISSWTAEIPSDPPLSVIEALSEAPQMRLKAGCVRSLRRDPV
jgi:hypothetical protein